MNISYILLTLETFQLPMSLLKSKALRNISLISVTFEVSQLPMSWLKFSALSNISYIVVALAVSHPPIFLLNPALPLNKELISVIPDVQQN